MFLWPRASQQFIENNENGAVESDFETKWKCIHIFNNSFRNFLICITLLTCIISSIRIQTTYKTRKVSVLFFMRIRKLNTRLQCHRNSITFFLSHQTFSVNSFIWYNSLLNKHEIIYNRSVFVQIYAHSLDPKLIYSISRTERILISNFPLKKVRTGLPIVPSAFWKQTHHYGFLHNFADFTMCNVYYITFVCQFGSAIEVSPMVAANCPLSQSGLERLCASRCAFVSWIFRNVNVLV